MKNADRDLVRLKHIQDAIVLIEEFSANIDASAFAKDKLRQAAIIREFEIIGEASANISQELRKESPNIEWEKIKGFRNLLVHEYFRVDAGEVWATIQIDLPVLKNEVLSLIRFLEKCPGCALCSFAKLIAERPLVNYNFSDFGQYSHPHSSIGITTLLQLFYRYFR